METPPRSTEGDQPAAQRLRQRKSPAAPRPARPGVYEPRTRSPWPSSHQTARSSHPAPPRSVLAPPTALPHPPS
eukprot:61755-Prymnesium_polylepis.1